jgi:hypothetical protein
MIAWWKIEPKDTTAILALILSVVTFLRTVRIDKRNGAIAAEQEKQEAKQEELQAISFRQRAGYGLFCFWNKVNIFVDVTSF